MLRAVTPLGNSDFQALGFCLLCVTAGCSDVFGNIVWHDVLACIHAGLLNAAHSPDLSDDRFLACLDEKSMQLDNSVVGQLFKCIEQDRETAPINEVRFEKVRSHAVREDLRIVQVISRCFIFDLAISLVRDESAVHDRVDITTSGLAGKHLAFEAQCEAMGE